MNGRTDGRTNAPQGPMRPILQGWLDRHEPASSGDLLFQVMREVETVEQRGTTRAWFSWFADSPAAGWMIATVMVAALAVAVVGPFGKTPPPVTEATATPTATVAPTEDAYPTPLALTTDELVDQLFADWNAGDYEAARPIYSPFADFRWADNEPMWNDQAVGRIELEGAFAAGGVSFTRTGPILQQGSWVGVPMTYELKDAQGHQFQGDAVTVLKVVNGYVVHHFVIGGDRWELSLGREAPALYSHLIEDHLAAVNAHDGEANAAFFAPSGQLRMYVGSWTVPEEYLSPDAIAGWTVKTGEVDFHLTRANSVIEQGTFLVYGWTMKQSDAAYPEAEGVAIVQIDADDHIVNEWVIGD